MATREEALRAVGMEEWFSEWEKNTNFSSGQLDFLKETWLMKHAEHLKFKAIEFKRRPMSPSQRNIKVGIKGKLQAALNDLERATSLMSGGDDDFRYSKDDLVDFIDAGEMSKLIEKCANGMGKDFADRILRALGSFYASQRERIMIQRSIQLSHAGLDQGVV